MKLKFALRKSNSKFMDLQFYRIETELTSLPAPRYRFVSNVNSCTGNWQYKIEDARADGENHKKLLLLFQPKSVTK
jgi:hypothetical protein